MSENGIRMDPTLPEIPFLVSHIHAFFEQQHDSRAIWYLVMAPDWRCDHADGTEGQCTKAASTVRHSANDITGIEQITAFCIGHIPHIILGYIVEAQWKLMQEYEMHSFKLKD